MSVEDKNRQMMAILEEMRKRKTDLLENIVINGVKLKNMNEEQLLELYYAMSYDMAAKGVELAKKNNGLLDIVFDTIVMHGILVKGGGAVTQIKTTKEGIDPAFIKKDIDGGVN